MSPGSWLSAWLHQGTVLRGILLRDIAACGLPVTRFANLMTYSARKGPVTAERRRCGPRVLVNPLPGLPVCSGDARCRADWHSPRLRLPVQLGGAFSTCFHSGLFPLLQPSLSQFFSKVPAGLRSVLPSALHDLIPKDPPLLVLCQPVRPGGYTLGMCTRSGIWVLTIQQSPIAYTCC